MKPEKFCVTDTKGSVVIVTVDVIRVWSSVKLKVPGSPP